MEKTNDSEETKHVIRSYEIKYHHKQTVCQKCSLSFHDHNLTEH